MAPNSRIFMIRHGQAEHNPHAGRVDFDNDIHDPPLTEQGKMQVQSLLSDTAELKHEGASYDRLSAMMEDAELIVTSPLKRTLETTLYGLKPVVDRLGLGSVICLPEAQECNGYKSDTGSSADELKAVPEFAGFNFDLLTDDWNSKQGKWSPDKDVVAKRVEYVRKFLRDREEKNIILVGHGDFIRRLIGSPDGQKSRKHWQNAEVRVFEFDRATVDSGCWLLPVESESEPLAPGFK